MKSTISRLQKKASASAQPEEDEDEVMDVSEPEDELDDEQDPAVSRRIRTQQRDLLNQTRNNMAQLTVGDLAPLEERMRRTQKLFKDVVKCPEIALDGKLISSISDVGCERARRLMTDVNNFSTIDFARSVHATMLVTCSAVVDNAGDAMLTREAWATFGKRCQMYLKRSPPLRFMFGSFARGPPIKKPRKEGPVKDIISKSGKDISTAPKVKSRDELPNTESTTLEVGRINKKLCEFYRRIKAPVCYFEFVINPESFAQSVENIFYTSFLINEGKCKLSLDSDKLPVIEPMAGDETSALSPSKDTNHNSFVFTLTKQKWREIIDAYGLTNSLIPTRPVVHRSQLKRPPIPS